MFLRCFWWIKDLAGEKEKLEDVGSMRKPELFLSLISSGCVYIQSFHSLVDSLYEKIDVHVKPSIISFFFLFRRLMPEDDIAEELSIYVSSTEIVVSVNK